MSSPVPDIDYYLSIEHPTILFETLSVARLTNMAEGEFTAVIIKPETLADILLSNPGTVTIDPDNSNFVKGIVGHINTCIVYSPAYRFSNTPDPFDRLVGIKGIR